MGIGGKREPVDTISRHFYAPEYISEYLDMVCPRIIPVKR
ncbi:hypothetical protein SAMN05444955_101291 [Lihuaxuella thermophila]|uniref:Uncharacterized protein n=1 Tax=Lihuaxuella thermophila TaxID=1173111 RepID=A0A1H8ATH9_9BACL|nr:hypothetical protein SAMN05444955_101291 [Lihuaxuella thermophila]